MSARASFPNPDDSGQAYFFKDSQYVVIKWAPGTTDDTIVRGPQSVTGYWPSLKEAGFETVDAVLPNPDNSGQAYFFSGEQYALIEINPGGYDKLITGPKSITDYWPSLKKAGFSKVDAAHPVPGKQYEAYFFSGTNYVRIRFKPGTFEEDIVYGPAETTKEWPSLKEANFDTIDSILQHPSKPQQAYFFSGSNYALIEIVPGTSDDKIITGPKSVAAYWPSLKKAGFY